MKYFTRKWAEGKMTDKAAENVQQKYLDNLYDIREQLPAQLRELTFEGLKDARISKLKIDKTYKLLQMRVSTSEGELEITYDTVQFEDTDDSVFEIRAKDPETQILFDEIDIGKTGYTHSFLFAPEGEACITFRNIRIKRKLQ